MEVFATVTHAERKAAIEQAQAVQTTADLELCVEDAFERVKKADELDFHAYLGGGFAEHLTGAFGELAFWNDARDAGLRPSYTPFGAAKYAKSKDDLRYYDYRFRVPGGDELALDVKTGMCRFSEAILWPLLYRGMLVPVEQVKKAEHVSDVYVYCIADTDPARVRVAVVGWCRWDTVQAYGVWMDLKSDARQERRPCVMVPLHHLHPMNDLYNILSGAVTMAVHSENNEVENLKCQAKL